MTLRLLCWVVIPSLTLAGMAWQGRAIPQTRQIEPAALSQPFASAPPLPLPGALLALAFGLSTEPDTQPERKDIVLKATFVPTHGPARALLLVDAKAAIHQVGDRLPGGATVRRISTDALVIWANGREQRLALSGSAPFQYLQEFK
ncbi:protein XcpP [Pseudomonas sp. PSKL.D1]|uniref:protein XcpP n=1 Tax=Pseudomonas sp. PSKL.D1 TaxID=3029060 RepID=UPI0023810F4D|nr:protein XcpP [Pseudomonas sp. PSKL.D1]WDY58355.1 protein XcpP [Pseudomonas sp. PSKL.D1]